MSENEYELKTEIDGLKVDRIGEATLTLRVVISDGTIVRKTWAAMYYPAQKGAEHVGLHVSEDEDAARYAFLGARDVLESIEKARENRKAGKK